MIKLLIMLCLSLIIALSVALYDSFKVKKFKFLTVTELRKKSKRHNDIHYKATKK